MPYIKLSDAAREAQTNEKYLRKLVCEGSIRAISETRGTTKRWQVDTDCPRYQKLLARLAPTPSDDGQIPSNHPIDWAVWESMCRLGEEIVKYPCSDATIKNYKQTLQRFLKTYRAINRDTLRESMQAYQARETKDRDYFAAKRLVYRSVMSMAKYYVFKGYETPGFVEGLRHLRPSQKIKNPQRRCYSEPDISFVIETINSAVDKDGKPVFSEYNKTLNTALVAFSFYTGVRATELAGILMDDVDLPNKAIKVHGKGGVNRFVGVHKDLLRYIKAYLTVRPRGKERNLFLSEDGTALDRHSIFKRMRNVGKWSKMKLAPHDLRRTAITWMLNKKKIPMTLVRDAVGHRTLAMINIYTKPTAQDVIEAMSQ